MKDNHANGYVFMASSLDGFVAREDHAMDWLMKYDSGDEHQGYDNFIAKIDALVLGSSSFKTVLGFDSWPYQVPVYIMSKSLSQKDVPLELKNRVFISNLDPLEIMQSLYKKGLKEAYVDGGKLVQSFIREGLVNEITITHIPILIGSGKRLFGELINDIDLKLLNSKAFTLGFVQNHYRIIQK